MLLFTIFGLRNVVICCEYTRYFCCSCLYEWRLKFSLISNLEQNLRKQIWIGTERPIDANQFLAIFCIYSAKHTTRTIWDESVCSRSRALTHRQLSFLFPFWYHTQVYWRRCRLMLFVICISYILVYSMFHWRQSTTEKWREKRIGGRVSFLTV